jgi:hypothetical protein
MTTSTVTAAGTVSRYWKTGLIITHADLAGIIASDPAAAMTTKDAARYSRQAQCSAWTCWRNSSSRR